MMSEVRVKKEREVQVIYESSVMGEWMLWVVEHRV
jgi:hypothetical protein